jgi:anti-sigma factor RsiW
MDKSPPPAFDEEAVAEVRERLRVQKQSGRPAPTYEHLVKELKERIKRASNPKDRAELERVLLESEAHEVKNAEVRAQLAKLTRRWDQSNRVSPFIVGMLLVGLLAVAVIGVILAKRYF